MNQEFKTVTQECNSCVERWCCFTFISNLFQICSMDVPDKQLIQMLCCYKQSFNTHTHTIVLQGTTVNYHFRICLQIIWILKCLYQMTRHSIQLYGITIYGRKSGNSGKKVLSLGGRLIPVQLREINCLRDHQQSLTGTLKK